MPPWQQGQGNVVFITVMELKNYLESVLSLPVGQKRACQLHPSTGVFLF